MEKNEQQQRVCVCVKQRYIAPKRGKQKKKEKSMEWRTTAFPRAKMVGCVERKAWRHVHRTVCLCGGPVATVHALNMGQKEKHGGKNFHLDPLEFNGRKNLSKCVSASHTLLFRCAIWHKT